jgi:TPR repeat protein
VPQDNATAQQWFKKAAVQGNLEAEGRPMVLADLQTLPTQAAQGDAEAQLKLGDRYKNGEGVPQDYTKARQWFEKSAAQGNAIAQVWLGMLYEDGQGVPQDYVQAYMWFNLAAAHTTGYEQEHAVNVRDKAARRMTPAQVAEAQRLAQQCEARQFKGC